MALSFEGEVAAAREHLAQARQLCAVMPGPQQQPASEIMQLCARALEHLDVATELWRGDVESQTDQHRAGTGTITQHPAEPGVLHTIMENTGAELAYLDAQFNFVQVNSAYVNGCGHARHELIGHNHFDLFPNAENQAIFERVRDSGQAASFRAKPFEFTGHPERGVTYWDWTLTPVIDAAGLVVGLVLSLIDVTPEVEDRRRMEALGAQSQRQAAEMEAIFSALVEPVTVFDSTGVIQRANPAAVASLGLDPVGLPEAILSRSVSLRYPDGRPYADDDLVVVRALRGETMRDVPQVLVRAEGDERSIVASAAPICDGDRIAGAVAVWHDITDQVRAADALRDSEAKLGAVFSMLPIGLSIIGPQQQILRQNAALTRILGMSEDGLLQGQHKARRYLRADGADMPADEFPSILAFRDQEEAHNVEIGVVKENGETIWTSVSAAPLPFADWRVAIATTDISVRRHALAQLEASERRFRAIVETASAAIITADGQGQIVSWNRMAEAIFGYPAGEAVGTPMLRIIPERLRPNYGLGLAHTMSAGLTRLSGETVEGVGMRNDGGEFPIEMSLATWRTAEDDNFSAIIHDISERKRVEEDLRQANQSIEALVQASPLAIITLDSQRRVRSWNPAAERILGWSEQEMIGQIYDMLPVSQPAQDEAPPVGLDPAELGQEQPLVAYETQRPRKDGATIDISVWSSPLRNSAGEPGGMMAIVEDVTSRKRAEEDLRRYADEEAALYAIASAVSAPLDRQGLLATVLDTAMPLLQADAASILIPSPLPDGQPTVVAWHAAPQDQLGAAITRALGECSMCDYLRGSNDDGAEPLPVTDCPKLIAQSFSAAGLQRHVCVPLSVGREVQGVALIGWRRPHPGTEREQRLLEVLARQVGVALHNVHLYQQARQLNRLRLLAEMDRALASSLDPKKVAEETLQHVATGLDAPAGAILLLPRPAGAATQVYSLAHGWGTIDMPAGQSSHWQGWLQGLAQGTDVLPMPAEALAVIAGQGAPPSRWGRSGLAVAIRGDKSLQAVLALGGRPDDRPFSEEDRALALVAASHAAQAMQNAQLYDELKRLLLERDQTRAQLIQSEKLAAMGRLVASLTHEINNPLQSVQGCLSLLEDELQAEQRRDKMDRYLAVVQAEIERIATIVRRMRQFSLPAKETMAMIDLRQTMDSILDLTGKQLQHSHVSVEREWSHGLPLIEANPDHMKQVFLNLVLNAIDAMPGGGSLCVTLAAENASIAGQPEQQSVRIEVRDSGQGMSAEVLSRVFEPFFTTKEAGAGLGLPVCYGIIQAHHGEIAVESQEGAGSTVRIVLPVVQP